MKKVILALWDAATFFILSPLLQGKKQFMNGNIFANYHMKSFDGFFAELPIKTLLNGLSLPIHISYPNLVNSTLLVVKQIHIAQKLSLQIGHFSVGCRK